MAEGGCILKDVRFKCFYFNSVSEDNSFVSMWGCCAGVECIGVSVAHETRMGIGARVSMARVSMGP